ncbi:MAG: hypothetical protein KC656_29835, partial [Myxococcales bacterium]|nr:hypothetical protein [Myxococcales bacterium]
PNVLILQNLDRIGGGARLRVDRTTALSTGYQRLTSYQVGAGGFETFGQGPGKEVLSAYGLLQFTDMERVWPDVDANMLQRDVSFLYAARDGSGGYTSTGRSSHDYGGAPKQVNDAFITWAMVESGHRDLEAELARQAALAVQTSDPYLLALAGLTLQHTDPTAAARAVDRLASLQDDAGAFPGSATTVVGSRGQNAVVETTGLATLAMLRDGRHPSRVRKAAHWLASRRSTYGWGSTQATVLALKALEAVSAFEAGRTQQAGAVRVHVDGETIDIVRWTGSETGPVELDLGPHLAGGTHEIVLETLSGPAIPYALEVGWSAELPADHPDAPLSLETALATDRAELGEPVRLKATVAAKGAPVPSPIARIGLPAGTRVDTWQLEQLKDRGEIAFFETRPREVTLYWEGVHQGAAHTVSLDLVPEVPGTFTAPTSSAYPYYDGERWGVWARGATLTVTP